MLPSDFSINNIEIGSRAVFSREISESDVQIFAELSGDFNPLHMDDAYAATTFFGKRVVHGMFLGSLCSKLVGMHLPGRRCLYLKQELSFKSPVYIGETVDVEGVVISKSVATSLVTITTTIKKENAIVVIGSAVVKII